jgi:hypothetical protein
MAIDRGADAASPTNAAVGLNLMMGNAVIHCLQVVRDVAVGLQQQLRWGRYEDKAVKRKLLPRRVLTTLWANSFEDQENDECTPFRRIPVLPVVV